jgi:hypothetical protein
LSDFGEVLRKKHAAHDAMLGVDGGLRTGSILFAESKPYGLSEWRDAPALTVWDRQIPAAGRGTPMEPRIGQASVLTASTASILCRQRHQSAFHSVGRIGFRFSIGAMRNGNLETTNKNPRPNK